MAFNMGFYDISNYHHMFFFKCAVMRLYLFQNGDPSLKQRIVFFYKWFATLTSLGWFSNDNYLLVCCHQHCRDGRWYGCYHTVGSSAPLDTVSRTEGLAVLLVACGLEGMRLASRVEAEARYGRSHLHQVEVVATLVVERGTGCGRAGYHKLVATKVVVLLDMGSMNDSRSSEILLHGPCHRIDLFGGNHQDSARRLQRGPS